MNRIIVSLIARLAVLFEIKNEEELPLDTAVEFQEELAFWLQRLSADDRAAFLRELDQIAASHDFREHAHILRRLPVEAGLLDD